MYTHKTSAITSENSEKIQSLYAVQCKIVLSVEAAKKGKVLDFVNIQCNIEIKYCILIWSLSGKGIYSSFKRGNKANAVRSFTKKNPC